MRTTVRLDDQLLQQVKALALETGTTLTAVIEDSLRQTLERRKDPGRSIPVWIPTFGGNGPRPGVDLDNSAALLDLMEDRVDPR